MGDEQKHNRGSGTSRVAPSSSTISVTCRQQMHGTNYFKLRSLERHSASEQTRSLIHDSLRV
jgi:hypothetical protein